MKILIGMFAAAALASILVAVNAANAQAYWGYDMGYQGVWGYAETGQGWHGKDYGYGYYQAYSAGYQQGLSDAETDQTYECSGHTQYYCNGYNQGFNIYENNSQQQTQTQSAEINVKGNGNYIGVNQEQSSGSGSYPAIRDDNSIQPGQSNPSCKVICLTIVR